MQRLIQHARAFLLLIALTLYGAAPAFSTPPEATATEATAGAPAQPAPAVPEAAATAPAPLKVKPAPHIALLLPLDSPAFGSAADAVKQGFFAAANVQSDALPITVYTADETPENILEIYQHALEAGAKIVVGPLTRNGVSALAASQLIIVPTLALNAAEGEAPLPPELYMFSLQVENDARQAAHLAFEQGKRKALIASAEAPLARRLRQAFSDEWQKLGGEIAGQFSVKAGSEALLTLRDEVVQSAADAVFLALDGDKARMVRPYLDNSVVIYATSLVFAGNNETLANFDLNGVQFLDMPWLLQPDHPAVMVYPRPEIAMGTELDRLYAFGIDAYRLALALLKPPASGKIMLDGVTGRLSLGGHQIQRELLPAQFSQGAASVLGAAKP